MEIFLVILFTKRFGTVGREGNTLTLPGQPSPGCNDAGRWSIFSLKKRRAYKARLPNNTVGAVSNRATEEARLQSAPTPAFSSRASAP